LLVEQYCEPTQYLCPCDHAFIYASSYFSKTIILATSPFSYYFICSRQEPRFIFETKLLSKTKYLQNYRDLQSRVVPLFYKLIFLIFIKRFQTPVRKLSKRDVLSPPASEKFYKRFTPLIETLFYLTMA
jgi:hypothetical protein